MHSARQQVTTLPNEAEWKKVNQRSEMMCAHEIKIS